MSLLQEAIIYIVAAIIVVPISKRLGFGSVLGYLAAGIIIGPFGLRFIRDPEHILHFAELGVVFCYLLSVSNCNRHVSGSCAAWFSAWAARRWWSVQLSSVC